MKSQVPSPHSGDDAACRVQPVARGQERRQSGLGTRRSPSPSWSRAFIRSTSSAARSLGTGPRSARWYRPGWSHTTGNRRPRTSPGSRRPRSSSTTGQASSRGPTSYSPTSAARAPSSLLPPRESSCCAPTCLRHAHDRGGPDKNVRPPRDPHVWLDPVLARGQVENIRAALAKADPDNAQHYGAQAKAFTERLVALHDSFEKGLGPVRATRDRRLARVIRLSGQALPSGSGAGHGTLARIGTEPAQLAQIVRFARRHQVQYIFFETLVSPKLADTLAREVGAKTLVLHPLEGLTKDDEAAGKNYVSLMEDNLRNLRTALDCT